MSEKRQDMDWVWAFLIALIAIIALHQPAFSIQKILIGARTFSFVEMALLKFTSGMLASFVIFGLCSAFMMRRPSKSMIWGAVVTQILYLEIEWGFSFGFADFGESLVRFAEELGVLASGLALLVYLRLRHSVVKS